MTYFAHAHGTPPPSLEERVAALEGRLLEALAEIGALRRERLTDLAARQRYADAYRSVSLDSHNAAGPSGGADKIVWSWLGQWSSDDTVERQWRGRPRPAPLRAHEWAMLVRLGLTQDELNEHAHQCDEREMYT